MLGGFQFTSRAKPGAAAAEQTGGPSAITAAAAAGLLALAVLAAPASTGSAEPGTSPTTPAPGTGPARAVRVSTSPEDHPAGSATATRTARPMRVLEDEPPLTRAAARQRVESMSPAHWLERFGPVVVERRD